MVFNAVRKHKWSKMLAKNKLWNILWICLENSNIKKKKRRKPYKYQKVKHTNE